MPCVCLFGAKQSQVLHVDKGVSQQVRHPAHGTADGKTPTFSYQTENQDYEQCIRTIISKKKLKRFIVQLLYQMQRIILVSFIQ